MGGLQGRLWEPRGNGSRSLGRSGEGVAGDRFIIGDDG